MAALNNASSALLVGVDCTREQLTSIPTPEATRTWHPVSHLQVLELVDKALERQGLKVTKERLGVSHEGHRFFGTLDLESQVSPGVNVALGVRNSTDKKFPIGLAVGERVFVCDNLCFSGDIVVLRKHTSRVMFDLDQKLEGAIARINGFAEATAVKVERLQACELTDKDTHDILVQSIDRKVIPARDITYVLQEWRQPQHEEFAPRTAWSLYNAYTESAKDMFLRNPLEASVRTMRLNAMFGAIAGYTSFAEETPEESLELVEMAN